MHELAVLGVLGLDSGAGVKEALGVSNTFGVSSVEGLVGRETELAVTAAAVRELSEGRASALVIEGEAGIGKTRLVQSIADDARARDITVFGAKLIRLSARVRSVWSPQRWI